jgi:hypothetical protein
MKTIIASILSTSLNLIIQLLLIAVFATLYLDDKPFGHKIASTDRG